MKTKIELHSAYVWDCDECGRENFCRGIEPEMSEEDIAHARDEYGIEQWEEGKWIMAPDSVTCAHCGEEFETDTGMEEGP